MNPIERIQGLACEVDQEKWEPKNGEEVEVSFDKMATWVPAQFVGMDGSFCVCIVDADPVYQSFKHPLIRKARPTITRTEAEALLNKRIID